MDLLKDVTCCCRSTAWHPYDEIDQAMAAMIPVWREGQPQEPSNRRVYGAALLRAGLKRGMSVEPALRTASWLAAGLENEVDVVVGTLGGLIVIGSLLAPFLGERFGHALLDWWAAGGTSRIRLWAALSLALGIFVIFLTTNSPIRR
jgi:hypothetical protein